jgi:hypothetical protein
MADGPPQAVLERSCCKIASLQSDASHQRIPLVKTSKSISCKNPKASDVKLIQSVIPCLANVGPRQHPYSDTTTVGILLEIRTLVIRSGIAPFERL